MTVTMNFITTAGNNGTYHVVSVGGVIPSAVETTLHLLQLHHGQDTAAILAQIMGQALQFPARAHITVYTTTKLEQAATRTYGVDPALSFVFHSEDGDCDITYTNPDTGETITQQGSSRTKSLIDRIGSVS